jgi:hypothetical protein
MIITYIYPGGEPNNHRIQVRCRNLSEAIQRTGLHQSFLLDLDSFLKQSEQAQSICARSDILVIYKHLYGAALRMVAYWKARDKRVLVDFDEALNLIPPDFKEYGFWMSGEMNSQTRDELVGGRTQASPLEQFRWGLRLVDSATVPSLRLAEDWRSITPIMHIADYLNINHYPIMARRDEPGHPIKIGIQCQAIGAEGLNSTGLLPALEDVARVRPNVQFHFFNLEASAVRNLHVAPHQLLVTPGISYQNWPSVLSNLDIGIAVVNDAYGMHSSPLPLTEFMILKIPWLASDLPPYRSLNQYGWLIPNLKENWERSLIEVIDYLDAYRKEAASGSFLYALGQDVSANIGKVIELYKSIL